jgi:hypothetical protein
MVFTTSRTAISNVNTPSINDLRFELTRSYGQADCAGYSDSRTNNANFPEISIVTAPMINPIIGNNSFAP